MKIKRGRNPKAIILLTGIAFFASGFDYLENGLTTLGILSIFVGILNFVAVPLMKKYTFYIGLSLIIINN